MDEPKYVNVKRRLILSFSILISIFLFFGLFALYDIYRAFSLTQTIYNHPLVVSNAALQSNLSITKMHRSMKDMVLFNSISKINQSIDAVNKEEKQVKRQLDIINNKILGEEGKGLGKEAEKLFDEWRPIREEVINLVLSDQREKAAGITVGKGANHVARLDEKMIGLKIYARNKALKFMNDAERLHSRLNLALIFFLILGILTSILVAFLTIKWSLSAQKDLKKSENLYRNLFNSSKDAIMTLEPPSWNFTSGNPAIIEMFEVKDEKEFTSLGPWDVSPEKQPDGQSSLEKANKMIQTAMEKGSNFFEWSHRRVNGEKFPATVLLTKVELDEKTFLQATVRDITKRKQAEEEKRKALEFAAEQRKHALIGQVAGKMAHDFNNILMGTMGNTQIAIMKCGDKKIKEKLQRILDLLERGKNITNNLLAFSIDQEPKQAYFRIEGKIDLVLHILEKDLIGIKIIKNYAPGIPEILGDPGMIQDVMINIIQNSIHAMSKVKNPTLNLKAYAQDGKVYFEIADNGCGIPKEHQESVYTPSFTLKGSSDKTESYKSGIKGTGYGMSNVKKYIVEKHKGDIYLESEVGKGTKITIALKIIRNYLSPDEKEVIGKSKIYDKRKILLVEDEPTIADVQYQILTNEPFHHMVWTAVNGQTAINIFDGNKFDVVSLDYMLPGNINGLDVYNHIRKKDKNVQIILISGNIEFLESMKELKEKDPNLEHLSKPVDNLGYVNMINELIGRGYNKSHS